MKLKTTLTAKDPDGNKCQLILTTETVRMMRDESNRQHRKEINKAHEALLSLGYDVSDITIK